MTDFDRIINRDSGSAEALIPPEVAAQIVNPGDDSPSAALNLFRSVNMGTKVRNLPVLDALPQAFWVDGDVGLKKTTEVGWDDVTLTAEELAVIAVVPDAVLDDADFDIWGEVVPLLRTAIGRALDNAIFFDVDKPSTFGHSVVYLANASSNKETLGTSNAAAGGVAGDISALLGKIEDDGYNPSAIYAKTKLKGNLRNARDANGQALTDVSTSGIYGLPVEYGMPGLFPSHVYALAGDFSQGIIGIRQDVTMKVLDQAALFDDSGNLVINLPQQDATAVRVVARYAYAVANAITYATGNRNGCPFGVLDDGSYSYPAH